MGKVLFVDDEQLILNSMKRGLRNKDYDCYYATSGKEALKVLEKIDIDVLFSDMKMPEMNGLELLKIVEEKYPDIIKGIISGYAQLPQLIATVNQTNIFKYIAKPFDLYNELVPIIDEALGYSKFKKDMKFKTQNLESKNEAYKNIFKTMTTKANTKEVGYDLLRIYNQALLKIIKEQVSDGNISIAEHTCFIDQYKNFGELYLKEIKKNEIYYEPARIINEIELVLKQDNYNIKIERGVDESSKNLYEGRGMHIKPVIICIIEDLVEKDRITSVKIISKEITREQNHVDMMYLVEFSNSVVNNIDLEMYNFRLYRSILNLFGGDIKIQETERKVDVVVKVRLQLSVIEDGLDEFTNS
ncbi:MAG: response regulator [Clostridiales bacterium]|nr:response regulator [Clostridiales bacterium]